MTSWNPGGTPDPSGEQPPSGQQPPPPPGYGQQPPPPPGYGPPPPAYGQPPPPPPGYGQQPPPPPGYGQPPPPPGYGAYPSGPNPYGTGEPAIGEPALPSKRFLAFLVDLGIFIIPAILFSLGPQWLSWIFSLALWLVFSWLIGVQGGQTPGMMIIGTKVVSAQTGQLIGFWWAVLRQLIFGICFIIPLSVFWSKPPLRQAWQDMAVKSIVIRVK